jgi:ribose-phosphate pyrophosphokinase
MPFDARTGDGRVPLSMKLVAGNSNRPLAEAICAHLKIPPTKGQVKRFADMEIFVEIQENVRGQDVFVIQSTSFPANDNLMELLILIDALNARRPRASRRSFPITVMRARTGSPGRARRSRPSSSPT